MQSRTDLLAFFAAHDIPHTTVDHAAVFTVEEAQGLKKLLPGAHGKNLFLKDAKGRLWLISALDTTAIDLKQLPKQIGSARLSFGSPELLLTTLGVTPGSVTAFALINDPAHAVTFVHDAEFAAAETVCFHPLENTATTSMSQASFRRFLAALGVEPIIHRF